MADSLPPFQGSHPAAWWADFTARLHRREVSFNDALGADVIAAIQSGIIETYRAPEAILGLLATHAPFASILKIAESNDDDALERLAREGVIAAAFDTELARFLLTNFIIANPSVERTLTAARRALLTGVMDAPERRPSDPLRAFLYALAQQCFLNEHAYWEQPDETLTAEILYASVEAMTEEAESGTDVILALLGCYRPLAPWPSEPAPALMSIASRDEGFHEMRGRLVEERLQEIALAPTFPTLTKIENATSQAVRAMYEENPYPRWRFSMQPKTTSAQEAIRIMFPNADTAAFPGAGTPRILLAGCGTGLVAAVWAQAFAGTDITAVDLSRASLAYAKRQSERLNLNLTYAQADILALDPAKLQFDIIECGGVLHHMADVLEGWRALTRCLVPGGLMRIALYNENARDFLDAPRQFARRGGYKATQKDIRRFRRDMMNAVRKPSVLPTGLLEGVLCPDFYSLSMARDAFFHIQEKEFSLRECLAMADQLGLRFTGLSVPSHAAQAAYRERFPHDPAIKDPAAIELFEQAQKEFAGPMYMMTFQRVS